MSWQGIEGQGRVVEKFRRALVSGRLASTFLFVGPAGVGKRLFATKLAQTLLCEARPAEEMSPCGRCASCQQVLAGTHPDFTVVGKPAERSFIPVSTFIGDGEQRMKQGLCHDIALKPFMGGRRIAVIDDADFLNAEGANCLLKTLEEPPPRSVLILIGTSLERQLPTIRSRCQVVRFSPLSPDILGKLIEQLDLAKDAGEARRLAEHSEGSLDRAIDLADPDLWAFRQSLMSRLALLPRDSVSLAQDVVSFVEAAGKEASARRNRARQVVGFAVELFRQVVRHHAGANQVADSDVQIAVQQATNNRKLDDEVAAACAQRSLDALGHIERNANQTTLLECWIDDLASITSGNISHTADA